MDELKLSELVKMAQSGDEQALQRLIQRLMPVIKRRGRRDFDEEAELIAWIANAVQHYKPGTSWGREELERFNKG